MRIFLIILISTILFSCKSEEQTETAPSIEGKEVSVENAVGFTIKEFEGYKILEVNNPWPGAEKSFKYLLVENEESIPEGLQFDKKINIPVKKLVVTSTTHIPSLEILESEIILGKSNINII